MNLKLMPQTGKRVLFLAGRRGHRACIAGHVGPFRDRPDITAWMAAVARQCGMEPPAGPHVDCLACKSTIVLPTLPEAA